MTGDPGVGSVSVWQKLQGNGGASKNKDNSIALPDIFICVDTSVVVYACPGVKHKH